MMLRRLLAAAFLCLAATAGAQTTRLVRVRYVHPACSTVAQWEVIAQATLGGLNQQRQFFVVNGDAPGCKTSGTEGSFYVTLDVGTTWRVFLRALDAGGMPSAWFNTDDGKGYLEVTLPATPTTTVPTTTLRSTTVSSTSTSSTSTTTSTTRPGPVPGTLKAAEVA